MFTTSYNKLKGCMWIFEYIKNNDNKMVIEKYNLNF